MKGMELSKMAEQMESQVNNSTKLNAAAPIFVPRTIVDGSNHTTTQAEGTVTKLL